MRADEPDSPVYVDVGFGRDGAAGAGAGRDGAAELGLLVTSGLDAEAPDDEPDEDPVDRLGDEGRLAPPLATARAAAASAADPEPVVPDGMGRVGSFVPADDDVAGFDAEEPDDEAGLAGVALEEEDEEPDEGGLGVAGFEDEPDGLELTLGEASVVIGAAPPPGLGRDAVPVPGR